MTESQFRIILGLWLIAGLYLNSVQVMYALMLVLLFEGVTNLRIPTIVSRIRYGQQALGDGQASLQTRVSFEAERALRLIVALFIVAPLYEELVQLWWLPWFVGFALIGAGLSGMCPMVLALKHLGLR